ncbi:hypothetical protein H8E88_02340 [candidate division KSB1 bacterium]|nr:hypothetical protein [candidate division KSB1 bacterium]
MKSLKKVFALFESEGTVFGALNKEDFNRIKNILPEEGIIQKFENIVQSMYNKIYINASGIHKLTSLRDLLLPKLMSGQIRVNK